MLSRARAVTSDPGVPTPRTVIRFAEPGSFSIPYVITMNKPSSSAIRLALPACIAVLTCLPSAGSGQEFFPELHGAYLGQKPPGFAPEVFAPGVISTDRREVSAAFTPDGRELYFCIFGGNRGYTVMVTKEERRGWTAPGVAPFSGDYSEVDVFINSSGERFLYVSKRPVKKGGPAERGYQIWAMDRTPEGWSEPRHLGPVVNFGERHLFPTEAISGTLYYGANEGGFGRGDIFSSGLVNGVYQEPRNLGPFINTRNDETDALISPDEDYIIFTSAGRADGYGNGDLYISFRAEDGNETGKRGHLLGGCRDHRTIPPCRSHPTDR